VPVATAGDQLEDRVEGHHLEARGGVQLRGRQPGEDQLGNSLRAVVAVVERTLEQLAGGVHAPVVDPPGIDAHRLQSTARRLDGRLEAPRDRLEQGLGVGVDAVGLLDRPVGEAGGLAELEPAVLERAEDHPPTGRPEIRGCEVPRAHRIAPVRMACWTSLIAALSA